MIRVLDKSIADKIAAGEVVERPLSIIKELVENSIDACATKIVVEIKDGGKTYIRVTDDGVGIEPEDCEKAFMRHATSKIKSAEDLNHIGTLGFRGEALASICAVSRTELLTKKKELKTGKKILIEGGQIVENQMYGCPDGTTMVIRDLFYNTPARLKFLKSKKTESSAVVEFVTQIALAYPQIKIRMINNDKILFATNGKGDRLKTIETLTSKVHTSALIPFKYENEGIYLEGYVSGPGESKSSRKNQIFFVNGRVVNSKVIEKGVSQAYSDRLFEGRFPICYLFLNVEPETMDVNIHPNKKEVRFYDETVISETVRSGIITALNSVDAVPKIKEKPLQQNIFKEAINEKPVEQQIDTNMVTKTIDVLANFEKKRKLDNYNADKDLDINIDKNEYVKEKVDINNILTTYEKNSQTVEKTPKVEIKQQMKFDFTKLQIVGQFFNTYIELCDDDTIYFIDQHAAHERVFFEKFLNQYNESEKHSQQIMMPIMLNVNHSDKECEDQWLKVLRNVGFTIEEFGPLSYRVTEIPMFFKLTEATDFLHDYIDNIGDYKDFEDKKTLDKIATKACKAAIKASDKISTEEIKSLLKDMSYCDNPFSCPHGRPVFIKITKSDMEKRFKRT